MSAICETKPGECAWKDWIFLAGMAEQATATEVTRKDRPFPFPYDASYETEEPTPELEFVSLAAWTVVLAVEASAAAAAVEALLTLSGSVGPCSPHSFGRRGGGRPRREEEGVAAERRRKVPRIEVLCRWKISSSCFLSSSDTTKL